MRSAVVIGVKSNTWGETPFAFVVFEKEKRINVESILNCNKNMGVTLVIDIYWTDVSTIFRTVC